MKRRDFLSLKLDIEEGYPNTVLSLDKYSVPLDKAKAKHLLRRTTFGADPDLIQEFVGLSADAAFEKIFGDASKPLPEGKDDLNWIDTMEEDPLDGLPLQIRFEIEGKHRNRFRQLKSWWLEQMRKEEQPFAEKLTLFWSTVWCIEFEFDTLSMIPPPLLYRNNQMLRRNRMGSYLDMAYDNTLDGAMLLYQSVNFSSNRNPNENFPRELLELFTMGIGNYSEGDIREASRVLTGFRTAAHKFQPKPNGDFQTYFMPDLHDKASKTIFGEIIPARSESQNTEELVRTEEVRRLIEIIFSQRPQAIAKFICEKIYSYFVYSNPAQVNPTIINELADTFVQNNFQIKPVLKKLFTSEHFFDENLIGCQFKTPPEFIVGLQRQLGVEYKSGSNLLASDACDKLEQELYKPPNVGSWKGYRTWLSTKTYPLRRKYAMEILNIASNSRLVDLASKFDTSDIDAFTSDFATYFLPKPISDSRRDMLKAELLGSSSPAQFLSQVQSKNEAVAGGIKKFISEIILSPDFHLL